MSESQEKVSAAASEKDRDSPISRAIHKVPKNEKTSTTNNMNELDSFLNESIKESNQVKQPWNKLKKQERITMLGEFAKRYLEENNIPGEEKRELQEYLVSALDKKRLSNVKEIVFDKEKQTIHSIPILLYCSTKRKFTLKRVDKRQSILKSLTPKKGKTAATKVVGNKMMIDSKTEEDS